MNINEVTLAGRLTRDPETTRSKSGVAICKIRLAVNRKRKNASGELEDQATFMDVTFFDRTAEVVEEYCRKGKPLYVRGRLEVSEWEDKETGAARSRLEVIGNRIEFFPRSSEDSPQRSEARPIVVEAEPKEESREEKIEKMDEIPF